MDRDHVGGICFYVCDVHDRRIRIVFHFHAQLSADAAIHPTISNLIKPIPGIRSLLFTCYFSLPLLSNLRIHPLSVILANGSG